MARTAQEQMVFAALVAAERVRQLEIARRLMVELAKPENIGTPAPWELSSAVTSASPEGWANAQALQIARDQLSQLQTAAEYIAANVDTGSREDFHDFLNISAT